MLNAKDYGVPQNRERAFMFSFLGEWDYEFPEPVKLEKRLKDVLEDKVDEKYYINNEKAKQLIDKLIKENKIFTEQNRTEQNRTEQNRTEQNRTEQNRTGLFCRQFTEFEKFTDVATTIMARDYKGAGNQAFNGIIETKHSTDRG